MYVDKRLNGVHAVQTLSRLNRIFDKKEETIVLDFANEADDIQKAFEPYYEKTLLKEGTDPNLLYDLQGQLENFHLYNQQDLDRFARVFFNPKGTQDQLYAALDPVVVKYKEISPEERMEFRGQLKDYLRLYAFLSQIIQFTDADLEKLFVFGKYLLRILPVERADLPTEIQQYIDITTYRVQKTRNGKISPERGQTELPPTDPTGKHIVPPEDLEPLSIIIRELNKRFGTNFSEEDKVFIQTLEEKLLGDEALLNSLRVNTPQNARLTFDLVVNDRLQEMIDSNFKFYKQVTDDDAFARVFLDWLFERYRERLKKGNGH
jgi:type I restriction enzyme R subunit